MLKDTVETGGVSDSQEVHKPAVDKELTAPTTKPKTTTNQPSKVQTGVSNNTTDVQKNSKENSKEKISDPGLIQVIQTWSELPDAIRSAILAIVRASTDKKER